jgi:hypothetical protein
MGISIAGVAWAARQWRMLTAYMLSSYQASMGPGMGPNSDKWESVVIPENGVLEHYQSGSSDWWLHDSSKIGYGTDGDAAQ